LSAIWQISLELLWVVHFSILPSTSNPQARSPAASPTETQTSTGRQPGANDRVQTGHRSESVQIKSDPDVVLAGELRIPAAFSEGHPVVLLLGGGGPSPHGIYPLLEERLLANGIATLSYDKRGVGKSTGKFVDTMDLMERDARAAVNYLRSRNDIDGKRIAVLGLSQGGVIGPALASDDPEIKAVVMLAAPAGKRGVMFLDEMRVKLTASGMRKDGIEEVMAATRTYMDALTTDVSGTAITNARNALGGAFVAAGWDRAQAEGALNTLSDPATVSLYEVAANDVLARVKVPILALYAADDTVISTQRSLPEARLALRHNPDAAVIEVPNVNHGFQRRESGVAGKPEYKGWPVSDPKTLDLIDRWLARQLLGGARG
jgi:uncharacterized protein